MAARTMKRELGGLPADVAKEAAKHEIERTGEVRRRNLSDPKPSKRDLYQMKVRIAERANSSDQATKDAALALLNGEAVARGLTAEGLRDLIIATNTQWEVWALAIAAEEATAKTAIDAAVDVAAVQVALDQGRAQILAAGSV